MKKQTLWKRIFGQKSNKKAKAQQAFQEQFDTKLRFRELEPRVVLDATVNYDMANDVLSVTYTDAGEVTLGRDINGKLEVGGTNLTFTGDPFNGLYDDVSRISVVDNTSKASELTFVGGMGSDALTGLVADLVIMDNVDTVNVELGADFSVTSWFQFTSNSSDVDDNVVNFDGKLSVSALNFIATATSSQATTVTDSGTSELVVGTLYAQKTAGATGDLSLDLTQGNHDFVSLRAQLQEVELSLVDSKNSLFLYEVNATELSLETAGSLLSNAAYSINVSGTASLTAATIDLDDSSVGHNFNKLTLNSTGSAAIVETDGFVFDGNSSVDGTLTIETGGAIGQVGGYLWANGDASFTVGDSENIDLDLTTANRFEGDVSVTGMTARAGAVSFSDGNGNFSFGDFLVTSIDLQAAGGVVQTTDGIDVSGITSIKSGNSENISLTSTNNMFGNDVSVQGQSGAANTVTIVDGLGDLTLDVIKSNTLNATSINGGIGQTTTGLEVSGMSTFTVANGSNIDLDDSGSNKFGTVTAKGASDDAGNVFIDDSDGGVVLDDVQATNLTVTAATFIDQTATGVKISNNSSFISGIGQTIDLNNSSNNEFKTISAKGASGAAGNVFIADSSGGVILDDIQATNLTMTSAAFIDQTATGVKVSDMASFTSSNGQTINLNNSSSNEFGIVNVKGASGPSGVVRILDSDGDLTLGEINAVKLFATAADRILQTTDGIKVFQETELTAGNGSDIDLDDSSANEFGTVSATGASGAAGDVFIADSDGGVVLDDIQATNLTVTAATFIDQTATGVKVSNDSLFTSGNGQTIDLNNSSSNQFGTVSAKGSSSAAGNIFVDDSDGGLILDDVQATNLTVTAATFIDQTATGVKVSGTSTFTSGNGQTIDLNNSTSNQFGTISAKGASDDAGNVFIDDSDGGVVLGDIQATNLTVTAATFIDQTATGLKVSGTSSFVSGDGQTIDLNNSSSNEFGTVNAKGSSGAAGNVFIDDSDGGLVLDDIQATNLTATAATFIDQTATGVKVSGAATFTSGNGQTIDLDNSSSNEFGTVSAKGNSGAAGNVFIDDSDAGVILDDVQATNLTVTAATFIDQTATGVKVSSAATFTSGDGQTIDLDNSSNNEFATVSAKGATGAAGTVFITDSATSLELDDVQVASLEVSTPGEITQTNTGIQVTGVSSFTSGDGQTIDLDDSSSNKFGIVRAKGASEAAGDVFIDDSDGGVILDDVQAANLTVTAATFIDQTAIGVKVSGTSSFTAGDGQTIDLNNSASNEFGTISATGASGAAGDVFIDDSDGGVVLDDIQATNLTVSSATFIDQTATGVKVSGTSSFTSGDGQTIDLNNSSSNEFATISTTGESGEAGNVFIADSTGDLELDDIQVAALEVSTVGEITQTGTGIKISGTSSFISGDGEDILINEIFKNVFGDTVSASGTTDAAGHLSIATSSGDLKLGAVDVSSTVAANLDGKIWQTSDGIQVSGNAQFSAGAGKDILLDSSTNNVFGGEVDLVAVSTSAGNVALNNSGTGLLLDQVSVFGDLTIATNGGITQTNVAANDFVQVGGISSFTVSDGADVELGVNTKNKFNVVNATGQTGSAGTVSLYDGGNDNADVTLGTADDGLTLGDIDASMLNLTTDGVEGDIDQAVGTSLLVSGMTTVVVEAGVNVDLSNMTNKLGSISVNAASMIHAGVVTIYDSGNENADMMADTADDGLVLKDIWADVLDVTAVGTTGAIVQDAGTQINATTSVSLDAETTIGLRDVTTPMLTLTAGGAITQLSGKLDVSGMLAIEVDAGVDVDLSDVNNELGSVSVNAASMLYAGTVTIYDGGNDNADAMPNTADDGLTLKDIYADTLNVTTAGAEGDIDQQVGAALHVTGMTMIEVDADVDVDLSSTTNELASIAVNATSMTNAGTVTIYDSANDDSDALLDTADDGLTLKDIYATTLNVTTSGAEGGIDQLSGTAIRVAGMTMIEVDAGVDVDLSSATNELASIAVNSTSMVFAGAVTIVDSSNDDIDALPNTADDGLTLKDVYATTLSITTTGTEGDIGQEGGSAIYVTGMMMIEVDADVDVDLSSTDNELASIAVNAVSTSNAGIVSIYDSSNDGADAITDTADDGLTLKDIYATTLSVTTAGTEGNIDQEGGSAIYVTGMTMIEVDADVDVDLSNTDNELASIAVNATSMTSAGVVTIVDSGNDDVDAMPNTADDGLTLKDIYATQLDVTTFGVAGHVDQEMGAVLRVEDATSVRVDNAADVLLSNSGNDFQGLISVLANDSVNDTPGRVVIHDDFADGMNVSLNLGEIKATSLEIEAEGTVQQPNDGSTKIVVTTGSTDIKLTAAGDIDLQYGDNDIATAAGKTFTVSLDMLPFLENFYLRNVNGDPSIPTGDLLAALAAGDMNNVTIDFPNDAELILPTIDIQGNLRVFIDGHLKQMGDIAVGDTAEVEAGTITLADTNHLYVTNNASFTVDAGNIDIGVTPTATPDDVNRGLDSGKQVRFGTLAFAADGQHVTIVEDDVTKMIPVPVIDNGMNLVGDNTAKSAFLAAAGSDIQTDAGSTLSVDDLAVFQAKTDVNLGNGGSEVDLRILMVNAKGNVSIVETSDFDGGDASDKALAIMNGTSVAGTLAIQTNSHIIQVEDIRSAVVGDRIQAGEALFRSQNSILLTDLEVGTLAASAGGTPLSVTPGSDLDFTAAGISIADGFGGNLSTANIDAFLPDENSDTFASNARAYAFVDGVGEDYSMVIGEIDGLVIGKVTDAIAGGGVAGVNGIRTNGSEAGHVFVRANGGDLTFGELNSGLVVGLANSGVVTALASGNLQIADGSWLHVTDGSNPNVLPFALVSTIEGFVDNPADKFEIDNTNNPPPNEGPAYSRIPGNVDTYVLPTQTGKDSVATIVLDQLGMPMELDFEVTLVFEDEFGNAKTDQQVVSFDESFNTDTVIEHVIPWEVATKTAKLEGNLEAYNSSQINLFGNVVDEGDFNNLNVVVDQFQVFFLTPIDNVPEMDTFVPPNNPYVSPIIVPEPEATPYASLAEITDDTRVATQIDGVTVVEVDPSDFMEIGEEIELDDDFMTLDAVKEFIQNGDQFPPGLYKIEILYPGAEVPEEHFYWKQDRPDPFDLFSHSTKPIAPQAVNLAAAETAEVELSAEEVWAREYDKWFPGAADLPAADEFSVPSAEGDSDEMIPREEDILLERVTTVSLQEIDRMTDRLRAKRSIVRDSLNGAMVGGAALMAAVAAQGRRDDEAADPQPDPQGPQPEESLDETSLGRLRRRVRHWL